MIIGQPGSGKSTMARLLGERLGLPVYHMDRDVFWLPGWQERAEDDRLHCIRTIIAQPAWVFEGYNSSTFQLRAERADTLIWLDTPLGLRLVRVVRRTLTGLGTTRQDLADGCPERLSGMPEFLWYILKTARRNKAKAAAFFDGFTGHKYRLATLADVRRFLSTVQRPETP